MVLDAHDDNPRSGPFLDSGEIGAELAEIERLCDVGALLQAAERAQPLGPVESWPTLDGQLLGARLARHLGAEGRAVRLEVRSFRQNTSHAAARAAYVRLVLSDRGPVEALALLPPGGEDLELLTLRAQALAVLRDFERSEAELARARDEDKSHPLWVAAQMTFFVRLFRWADARRLAERIAESTSLHRLLAQMAADIFARGGDLARASAILERLPPESSTVLAQLAVVYHEQRRYHDEQRTLELFIRAMPWASAAAKARLLPLFARCAYARGDRRAALAYAEQADGEGARTFCRRLKDAPPAARRVELDVPFVQQSRTTCVPAVLASLTAYFAVPADHDGIAREICYSGTPNPRSRAWAERNGFTVREFSADWETARTLIDRRIPFVIFLQFAAAGHVQLVVGYDETTRTVVVQDPSSPLRLEVDADGLFSESRGRHAMLMVPASRRLETDGLELHDEAAYDEFFAFESALEAHDRDRAAGLLEALKATRPEHIVTLRAQRSLAVHDANRIELLEITEVLVRRFPDDAFHRLSHLGAMKNRVRAADIREAAEREASSPRAEPQFVIFACAELAVDAREHSRVSRYLRRLGRKCWDQPGFMHLAAQVEWRMGSRERALERFRWAACLDDTNDGAASNYFATAAASGKAEEGLAVLHWRREALGHLSGCPTVALAAALESLDRPHEALGLIREALAARPNDGDLLAHGAGLASQIGDVALARDWLERAARQVPRIRWLRLKARIDESAGDCSASLASWQEATRLAPDDEEAHHGIARHRAREGGIEAAIAYMAEITHRYPENHALAKIEMELCRMGGADRGEAKLREVLERGTADAAWLRTLAFLRLEEGGSDCERLVLQAGEIDPHAPDQARLWSAFELQRGSQFQATERLARAAKRDPDHAALLSDYFNSIPSHKQRAEALQDFAPSLAHAMSGQGCRAWYELARGELSDAQIEATLASWRTGGTRAVAWLLSIDHLLAQDRLDVAEALAREALDRFPLHAEVHARFGLVLERKGDLDGAMRSYRRGLSLSPAHAFIAAKLLSAARKARAVESVVPDFLRALELAPFSLDLRLVVSDVHRERGDAATAIETLRRVVSIEPRHEGAWQGIARPDPSWPVERALELLRVELQSRPWNHIAALVAARALAAIEQTEEAIAVARRALQRSPRAVELCDFLAGLLTQCGRADEALATCSPSAFGSDVPYPLRARKVWIDRQRGLLDQAIDEMNALVARWPGYVWGLMQLAEWSGEKGHRVRQLEVGRRLVRLVSESERALAWLAQLEVDGGDRPAGKKLLERARRIQADSIPVTLQLLWLHIDDGESEAASGLLQSLAHQEMPEAYLARLRVALLTKDVGAAEGHFTKLCQSASEPVLAEARRRMADAGEAKRAQRVLEKAVPSPDARPEVGAVFVYALLASEKRSLRKMWRLDPVAPSTTGAVQAAFASWIERKQRWRVRKAVFVHWSWLRRGTGCWGIAGGALTQIGDHGLATLWGLSWRRFTDARPWVLRSVAISMRARRLERLAIPLEQYAAELSPPDATTGRHRLWAAFEEAARGRLELARKYERELRASDPRQQLPEIIRKLTAVILTGAELPRAEAYARARAELARMFPSRRRLNLLSQVDRAYALTARALARQAGTPAAWLWANTYRLLFTVPLVGLAVLAFVDASRAAIAAIALLLGAAAVRAAVRHGRAFRWAFGIYGVLSLVLLAMMRTETLPLAPVVGAALYFLFTSLQKKR